METIELNRIIKKKLLVEDVETRPENFLQPEITEQEGWPKKLEKKSGFSGPSNPDGVHRILTILNEALATQIVSVLRCEKKASAANDAHDDLRCVEFKALAGEAQIHVDRLSKRLAELKGEPIFKPLAQLMKSYCDFCEIDSLQELFKESWEHPLIPHEKRSTSLSV